MIPTLRRFPLALANILLATTAFAASDVVTVGTATANGTTVDVPVFIRDVSGTPLGQDQPAGSKIQSYSIKVTYSPASAVQSVTFSRAGITAGLSPTSEFNPTTSNSISLLDTFKESTNPIPFHLDAGAPGDQVAHLVFTLSSSAAPGSSISLTLDPSLTQLTDEGGTAATKETPANGRLTLVNGVINIPNLTVRISPTSANVMAGATRSLSAITSSAVQADTTITLSSSSTATATVPASVVIPAGMTSASFIVSAKAIGTTTITATLPQSAGGASGTSAITVVESTPQCPTPQTPQLNAPSSALAGASYVISWAAVADATDYVVDESTDAGFATVTTQIVTTTTASFTHATAGIRYYYRVTARNRAGNCDTASQPSPAASVLITAVPTPDMRVLAVVGSTPGSFGSYFKTSVQLFNPKDVTISGKIVFHRQAATGTASDPALVYSIAPGKTASYADLLPAAGVATGLGSADIVADLGSPLPVSLVRVFNDAGAAGTTGFGEDQLDPATALEAGSTGALIAPSDVQKFRLNIGVRTLEAGAAMTITVRDKDGVVVKTAQRSYDPTYFAQVGSGAMLDGYVLTGGETISFAVTSGSAFIYGATTDNTTNDPSVQIARRIE